MELFLRRIVESLLEGFPKTFPAAPEETNTVQSILPSPFSNHCIYNLFFNFASDFGFFQNIVLARCSLTRDHLWLLQTEPQHLRRHVRLLR